MCVLEAVSVEEFSISGKCTVPIQAGWMFLINRTVAQASHVVVQMIHVNPNDFNGSPLL